MELNYTQMSRSPFVHSGPRRRKSTNEEEMKQDIQSLHEMEAHLIAGQPRSSQVEHHSNLEAKQSLVMNGRSVGRVYKPPLKEKIRRLLNGKPGLIIELLNLFFSLIAFGIYVSELYENKLYASVAVQSVEIFLMCYFIFDLILHLVAAKHSLKYLFSMYGLIDLITIIPALTVYFLPSNDDDSQWILIVRVLRIFRALRVLRLQQFLSMKKRGFDYELTVFILSIVATILCAAGLFQALEEPYYTANDQVLTFHDSLYFVLVTISTVGYGDISPKTIWSHFFVMGIIICVFTFIPRQITRLNELAKEEHAYDKEYTIRHNHRSTSRTKTTWSFWSTWSWSFWSKTTTATTSITTGHVIVSGVDLSMEIVRDFLTEFYHPTRGNILLDVIFLSEKIPSKALIRFLQNEKYRDKTLYLRGTLTLQKDQKRVQLNHATAVFLLTKVKEFVSLQEKKQIDATLLLQALSVRNALSPPAHHHIDVYLQRLTFTSDKANLNNEEEEEEDMACFLLGANIMKIIPLQHAMLARASICPGTGVFLLNLIRSVDINVQYAKYRPFWNDSFSHTSSCVWLDEYIDGMSYQIYPIIFSKKFRGLLFEQVVEEIYRHYRAIVFALHVKNHMTHGTKLCPFGHVLQEGMIGFILAKNAAVGHMIVRTYGYWEEEFNEVRSTRSEGAAGGFATGQSFQHTNSATSTTTGTTPSPSTTTTSISAPGTLHNSSIDGFKIPMLSVQVSTDTLLKRMSPRSKFRRGLSSSSVPQLRNTNTRSIMPASKECKQDDNDENKSQQEPQQQQQDHPNPQQLPQSCTMKAASTSRKSTLYEDYEQKKKPKNEQELKSFLQDHTRLHTKGYHDHMVLCGRSFTIPMALVKLLRLFFHQEATAMLSNSNASATDVIYPKAFVLLLSEMPSLHEIALYLDQEEEEEFENVIFVHGSADHTKDLIKVSAANARRVVLLPLPMDHRSFGTKNHNVTPPIDCFPDTKSGQNSDESTKDESSMDDFRVIKALLALEMVQKLPHERKEQQKRLEPVRRRASGCLLNNTISSNGTYTNGLRHEEEHGMYHHREHTHGLPIDLVRIRMMERFPSMDFLTENNDDPLNTTAIATAVTSTVAVVADDEDGDEKNLGAHKYVGVLQHAQNLKYCRPRDSFFYRDELPFLSPAFACGNIFTTCVFDRILCQAFYNPYILDVLQVLTMGENNGYFLTQMKIPLYFLHGFFGTLFEHFIKEKQILIVALWRLHPDADADADLGLVQDGSSSFFSRGRNTLPFCMTCPSFDTILEQGDRIFVLKK